MLLGALFPFAHSENSLLEQSPAQQSVAAPLLFPSDDGRLHKDKELGDLPKEFPLAESKSIIMVGLVMSREVSMSQWCGRPESLRPGK